MPSRRARCPTQAQLGLEATYRLYETAEGWVFLDARFDADFAALAKAMGFMVKTQSAEFADKAPDGKNWRPAPVVKFSDTPCEAALSYEGPATHTREVLHQFGYGDAAIDGLAERKVVAVEAAALQPISY
jgi:crotonobetainyl-CoA:carnitine CoA-transferase CaiB-like acyl-CoA transferase